MTTTNDSEIPFESFDRYLRGEPTSADERTIDEWARQHPAARYAWLDLRDALREPTPAGAEQAVQALRQRIAMYDAQGGEALALPIVPVEIVPPRVPHGRLPSAPRLGAWSGRRWLATGAAALSLGLALLYGGARMWRSSDAPIVYDRTYVARTMQVAQITLEDGTHIALAPNSTLRVGRQGSPGHVTARHVILNGEALFDVQGAADRPFIVHALGTETRVLGTRFDVRAQGGTVRVVVASGRVALTGGPRTKDVPPVAQSVVLAAGMMGTVTDSTMTAANVSDAADYTAWVDGKLVFHETPVSQVLATLERWYGFRFRLVDTTLAHQQLTARFGGESSAEMLRALSELLQVTLAFNDSNTVVTLRPRQSTRKAPPKANTQHDALIHPSTEVGR